MAAPLTTKVPPRHTGGKSGDGARAALIWIHPPGAELGRRFELTGKATLTLGRGSDCDIHIDRDSVSRSHARLFRLGDLWQLSDLGSTNGSFINDARISQQTLSDGDRLTIGDVLFKFLLGSNLESSYHEELHRMSVTDALTQAYNKRYFVEALERDFAGCQSQGRPISLLLLNIDYFRRINAELGQLTGDFLLREFARRVSGKLRPEDTLARHGGDEFALLLPGLDAERAMALARDLRGIIANPPFMRDGAVIALTVSIGLASGPDQLLEAKDLIQIADQNLARAKRRGRDRAELSGKGADAEPRRRPLTDLAFRRALEERPPRLLFAMALANRAALAAGDSGAALVDDMEDLIDEIAGAAVGAADLLGTLPQERTLLIAPASDDVEAARGLAGRIEDGFERERAGRGMPPARVVHGRIVTFAGGSATIARAVEALEIRLAEASSGDHLPLPIAAASRHLQAQSEPIAMAFALVRLHETITRWLATLLLAELRALALPGTRALTEVLLKSPSLGQWVAVLRDLAKKLNAGAADKLAFPFVLKAVTGEGRKRSELFATLDEFVKIRNDFVHDGGGDKDISAVAMVKGWAPRFDEALRALDILRRVAPLQVREMEVLDDSDDAAYRYSVRWLIGEHSVIPPATLVSRRKLRKGLVYAMSREQDLALALEPLAIYETCPQCKIGELLFLDVLHDGKATFRSHHDLKGDIPEITRHADALAKIAALAL